MTARSFSGLIGITSPIDHCAQSRPRRLTSGLTRDRCSLRCCILIHWHLSFSFILQSAGCRSHQTHFHHSGVMSSLDRITPASDFRSNLGEKGLLNGLEDRDLILETGFCFQHQIRSNRASHQASNLLNARKRISFTDSVAHEEFDST
jgi:hypothetical protein